MEPWPDEPFLQGYYEPLTTESTAPDLVVEGEIPAEINGTFYRNGPNPQFPPKNQYHFFTGDGMVHAFTFDEGRVAHRNRWARTARFEIERRLGGSYFSGVNPLDTDPALLEFVMNDKEGVANTAIVWHGDRLLLLEEGHLPFEMDPQTLDSRGSWDFYGRLRSACTAHPKVDPGTGELIFFDYMTDGPFTADMSLHVVDPDGFITAAHRFEAPYPSMVHDFVVTPDHIVFPAFPLTGSMERAMTGQPPFMWEPDRPTMVGVMDRKGSPDDLVWVETDPRYVFHYMNAYEDGGAIVFDACEFTHAPLFPGPDGQPTPNVQPRMTRWRVDVTGPSPTVAAADTGDWPAEFPVIDRRFAMQPYRHGWTTSTDATIPLPVPDGDWVYNTITHVDVTDGTTDRYSFPHHYVGEPMFVARHADGDEADGWLLSCVYDIETNTSALCVFDALDVAAGPIGRALVSHRVPVSFHGTWVPGP